MAFLPTINELTKDIQGGGSIANVYNTLTNQALNQRKQQLENQYYGPNIQSEINERLANTVKQNILNQYLPEKERLANEYAGKVNQLYIPKSQAEIDQANALTNKYNIMTPLEAEKQRILNKYLPEREKAFIESSQALSNYRMQGGAGAGVDQKLYNSFKNQLAIDNPGADPVKINQMANAALAGSNVLPDGSMFNLSPLSGDMITKIQKKNSTAAIQNQAANLDVLYNELSNFDIDAVKEFAGPQGRIRLGKAKLMMATNPDDPLIDPVARRYLTAMKQAIFNMDSMRKSFGTSVVPQYVYATLGRLSNPNDSIWNDPKQVERDYKAVLDAVKTQKDMMAEKSRHGATASLSSEKKVQRWGRDKNGKPVRIS